MSDINQTPVRKSKTASKKKWLFMVKYLFFCIACALFLFAALEILIRFTPYEPKTPETLVRFVNPEWRIQQCYVMDPVFFWKFRPNQHLGPESDPDFIRINNIGLRGADFPDPEAKDAYRIMFLGDSCTFGIGAESNSFPKQLVDRLGRTYPKRKFSYFHGGVPGYSSHQALALLKTYGKKYAPHAVVMYVGSNDWLAKVDCSDLELSNQQNNRLKRQSLLEKSRLISVSRDLVGILSFSSIVQESTMTFPMPTLKNGVRVPLQQSEKNFREMVRITKELGAYPIIVTRQDSVRRYPADEYNEMMRKVASETDSTLVEAAKYFADYPMPETIYWKPEFDTVHPNEKGYRAIALLALEQMINRNLIESVSR
jgi:lysophospholipase L1-like esterase